MICIRVIGMHLAPDEDTLPMHRRPAREIHATMVLHTLASTCLRDENKDHQDIFERCGHVLYDALPLTGNASVATERNLDYDARRDSMADAWY